MLPWFGHTVVALFARAALRDSFMRHCRQIEVSLTHPTLLSDRVPILCLINLRTSN